MQREQTGKRWKQLGQSSGGRERECSVDGQETVEIAWGELRWEGATLKCKAADKVFSAQIPSMRLSRKTACPRLVKWFPNAGQWDMHGKKWWLESFFIPHGVLSVHARCLFKKVVEMGPEW